MSYANNVVEHFFVLEVGGEVQACGGYYVSDKNTEANLVWGMVQQSKHGNGYGTALLKFRLMHIQKNFPKHSVILDTSQHTHHFFEKLGFVCWQITEHAYGEGLHRYDMRLPSDHL